MHDDYLKELDEHLKRLGVETQQREHYIQEIGHILDEGVDLGDAGELAEHLAEADARSALADSVFEPGQSSWWTERRFGKGYDINWGKVAVELGLILPDEVDDEVLAAIPPKLVETLRWLPAALAAATAVTGAAAARRGLPMPLRVSLKGRVKKSGPPWTSLAFAGVSAVLAGATALGPRAKADTKTLLIRSADATSLNLALLAQIHLAFSQRGGRVPAARSFAWTALVLAAQAAILILPAKAGRARVA